MKILECSCYDTHITFVWIGISEPWLLALHKNIQLPGRADLFLKKEMRNFKYPVLLPDGTVQFNLKVIHSHWALIKCLLKHILTQHLHIFLGTSFTFIKKLSSCLFLIKTVQWKLSFKVGLRLHSFTYVTKFLK